MKRYFEFIGTDGKTEVDHSKFWEIWVDGTTLRTRYGKIGANGQTTLKSFDSVADAEAGMVKAIAEKTKKGYSEPSAETTGDGEITTTPPNADADSPEVVAAKKAFTKWAKKYKPVALIVLELEEIPHGIPNELVWSQCDVSDYCCLTQGFSPYDDSSRIPVFSHVITSVPFKAGDDDSIVTELTIYCETCDAEGYIDDEECPDCGGDGKVFIETSEEYPLVISTQEELDTFTGASSQTAPPSSQGAPQTDAKFCAECGTKREPLTAKFCSECGSSF